MVKCKDCGQEMQTATTCTLPYIKINGKWYKRNTSYYDVNVRCHDCGIVNHSGHIHHFGCDIERCPKCKGQLISCGHGREEILSKTMPAGTSSTKTSKLKSQIKSGLGLDIKKETGAWK